MRNYTLIGHEPVRVISVTDWARSFESIDRRVALDEVGVVQISTVFLGIDHNFSDSPDALPILFETMVFGGKLDGEQERYHTWDEATKGHAEMLTKVKKAEGEK